MAEINSNLSKAARQLSVFRDRPPRRRLHRGAPGRKAHQAGHRRRDPPPGPGGASPPCTRRWTRWAPQRAFHGYGPEQGYDFLREAIAEHDYARPGRGDRRPTRSSSPTAPRATAATSATSSATDNVVAVCDPVYPVYVDTNAMAGRAGDYDEDSRRWTKHRLHALHGGERLLPGAARGHGGPHLPLLPQQPHRRGGRPGSSSRPGWTTPTPTAVDHPL